MINYSRNVIFLRGTSSSGKSSFADYLENLCPDWWDACICTADDFFYQDGEYKFDAEKLGFAHNACRAKYLKAIEKGLELIIVANTSTRTSDVNFYQEWAEKNNYTFFSLVVERRHGKSNNHAVPEATLEKQEAQIHGSLKLR